MFYFTCGHFLHKKRDQSTIHQLHDGLSFSPWVRHQEGKTSWTSIWSKARRYGSPIEEENATKSEISKESLTDSYEIRNSAFEWLKMVETKIFVDDGMLLRMMITLTIGFIQISKVLILCHWGIDLISSRHCLPCNDCNKKREKNHMCLLTLTSTNNGRYEVHLLHGGFGKVHGGLLIIPKVKEMHQVFSGRADMLLAVFGKLLRKNLHEFNFIRYRLIV